MKTADPEFMRAINRFHVMDAIRRSGPISRIEIADNGPGIPDEIKDKIQFAGLNSIKMLDIHINYLGKLF